VDLLSQIEDVSINLCDTEEAVEPWVGLLELAALRLTGMKYWTSRVELDVVGLRQRWQRERES
jgi:hypothetical protein